MLTDTELKKLKQTEKTYKVADRARVWRWRSPCHVQSSQAFGCRKAQARDMAYESMEWNAEEVRLLAAVRIRRTDTS